MQRQSIGRIIHWQKAKATVILPDSPVSRLVSRPAVGTEGTATLAEAARLMRLEGVSSVLIDGGDAILTERDISRGIGAGADPDEPVGIVASPNPITVDASLPIVQCAGILLNEQFRHLVVRMPEGWNGVISLRDVVVVLLQHADPKLWLSALRVTLETPSENWLG